LSLLRQERKAPWLGAEIMALPWWRQEPKVEAPTRGVDALGWSSGPGRHRVTAEEFLARIGPLAEVTIEELASPRRTPELVDARELIGGVAIERWGIQVKALAEALGKSREGVSKWYEYQVSLSHLFAGRPSVFSSTGAASAEDGEMAIPSMSRSVESSLASSSR
jgi:hypothetical protein